MLRVEPSPPASRWDWARAVLLATNPVWTSVPIGFDFHLKLPALAMTAATLAAWVVA
jgi:hypothetical protein